jgi:hypothetical protein
VPVLAGCSGWPGTTERPLAPSGTLVDESVFRVSPPFTVSRPELCVCLDLDPGVFDVPLPASLEEARRRTPDELPLEEGGRGAVELRSSVATERLPARELGGPVATWNRTGLHYCRCSMEYRGERITQVRVAVSRSIQVRGVTLTSVTNK